MIYVWLGFVVFFVAIEATTYSLVSIWFALGAVVSIIAASLGAQMWIQIVLFIVASFAAVVATRPLARRFTGNKVRTNADRNIGQAAIVTEEIDNIAGTGRVNIGGKSWSARSEESENIPEGSRVIVQRIEGVKVFVKIEK